MVYSNQCTCRASVGLTRYAHFGGYFFMKKRLYSKSPLTVTDQIELLKTRGLIIPDEKRAVGYLQNIGYYRLSGYMYPFLKDKKQHQYIENTTFDCVLNLYRFDRELRQFLFASIEKIEIAIRAQISNNFSVDSSSPFWYTMPKYFSDTTAHNNFLGNISVYINRSNDIFIKHFFNTYTDPYPPIWVFLEILSMGQLSILYSITAKSKVKNAVSDYFGIKIPVLENWLHALVYVRNICAHHARLWNKELSIQIKFPKKANYVWLTSGGITNRKIYEVLAIIAYFLDTIIPQNTFRKKLEVLLFKYPNVDISAMGFPKDWKKDPFWNK